MPANLDPMVYPIFFQEVMQGGMINWATTLTMQHLLETVLLCLSTTIIDSLLDT